MITGILLACQPGEAWSLRVWFARHGDGLERGAPDPGKPRHPAHAAGRAQAETLAETVATLAPALSRVYTSPLCRALETAQCVADRLGCPCTVLTGLREIDFGDWEGKTWAEAEAENPAAYARFCQNRRTERPPRGESCQDALDRLLPALRQALSAQTGDILFLTHSALLKALLCLVGRRRFPPFLQTTHCKTARRWR